MRSAFLLLSFVCLTALAQDKSAVVYFQPAGEQPRPVTLGPQAIRDIAAARAKSTMPLNSSLPAPLLPLVMDFIVLHGGPSCRDYRFVEARPSEKYEAWTIHACGRPEIFHIVRFTCDRLLGTTGIAVAPFQPAPRPIYYGVEPLETGAWFRCPDLGVR